MKYRWIFAGFVFLAIGLMFVSANSLSSTDPGADRVTPDGGYQTVTAAEDFTAARRTSAGSSEDSSRSTSSDRQTESPAGRSVPSGDTPTPTGTTPVRIERDTPTATFSTPTESQRDSAVSVVKHVRNQVERRFTIHADDSSRDIVIYYHDASDESGNQPAVDLTAGGSTERVSLEGKTIPVRRDFEDVNFTVYPVRESDGGYVRTSDWGTSYLKANVSFDSGSNP
jgi:hypothetical protein